MKKLNLLLLYHALIYHSGEGVLLVQASFPVSNHFLGDGPLEVNELIVLDHFLHSLVLCFIDKF
jgi:hypothetical protein